MASNSSLVWAVSPLVGVDLDSKSSAYPFAPLTPVWANDGHKHIYAIAAGSLASTANITIGTGGTAAAAASAGVANSYTVNTTGGVVVGQHFWARSNAI
jgi:hypothetical protein